MNSDVRNAAPLAGRDGEAVIAAGTENEVQYVKYVQLEQDAPRGSVWVGDCGHPVRPGSALDVWLRVIPIDQPVPLQRNG